MNNKFNFVRDRLTKLPPGFRFQPTDEELAFQYLKCKVLALPLPASIIPDINARTYDPWDFPGEFEGDKYFFSNNEVKYRNGSVRVNRATASGYWKATGMDKKIVSSSKINHNHQMVGMRKTLVFHRGKPSHGTRTNWIMHEYRLIASPCLCNNSIHNQMGNWVLCHVFLKKRRGVVKNEEEEETIPHSKFFDFRGREDTSNVSPSSSSCCSSSSSTITEEVSSRSSYYEENGSIQ